MELLGVLEGLLFAIGDEGITIETASKIMSVDTNTVKSLLKSLQTRYEGNDYGIRISYIGNAFKLTTKKEHKEYYQKLLGDSEVQTLSDTSLEVLAIIAYNQPITRGMVDEMRGVASSQIIRKLCARGLIKVSGKSNMPGRPNLYSTTKEFLDYFGLATINELPKIEKVETKEKDDTELFSSIYKEPEYVE